MTNGLQESKKYSTKAAIETIKVALERLKEKGDESSSLERLLEEKENELKEMEERGNGHE